MDQNRVLKGTSGSVWLNGLLLSNIKKIELKISGSFEEVSVCGEYGTFPVYVGWTGEGSIALFKIDSSTLALLKNAYKTGVMPDIKIISKLTDEATKKSERVAVSGVVFTEFNLANYESKGIIEDEFPLKFSDYEVLEEI